MPYLFCERAPRTKRARAQIHITPIHWVWRAKERDAWVVRKSAMNGLKASNNIKPLVIYSLCVWLELNRSWLVGNSFAVNTTLGTIIHAQTTTMDKTERRRKNNKQPATTRLIRTKVRTYNFQAMKLFCNLFSKNETVNSKVNSQRNTQHEQRRWKDEGETRHKFGKIK